MPSVHAAESHVASVTFGGYIRELREHAGLSLRKAAARLLVTKSHYAHVELGTRAPFGPERWGGLAQLGADPALLESLRNRYWDARRLARPPARDERARVPPGHPGSASWEELPWEDDDWSWYVVAHHPDGLTTEQVGDVMGISAERVRQIEAHALATMRERLEGPAWGGPRPDALGACASRCHKAPPASVTG
jgi:transcriptional regulator with XRE-family HTH domain